MADADTTAPHGICIECGAPKTRAGKGPRCGSCEGKRRRAHYAELWRLFHEGKYQAGMHTKEMICRRCGRLFPATRSDLVGYCSKQCGSRDYGDAVRVYATKQEAKRAERERARLRLGLASLPREAACGLCGETFKPKQTNSMFCSYLCRAKALDDRDRTPRPCACCGTVFIPEYGNKRRTYCSTECLRKTVKRVAKATRRARSRGIEAESVDPFKVFERDGWRCHLCRRKTPKDLRGTVHDRAPELDHIQPLAAGGSHTYANTACACRACNQAKGARSMEQLPLFAHPGAG